MKDLKNSKILISILTIMCVLILIFGIPIIINELYKMDDGYVTLWGAPDVLSFYATILSSLITIVILIITLYYNKKDMNKELKFYMSQTNTPFFVLDNVSLINDNNNFVKNQDGWVMSYRITQSGSLFNTTIKPTIMFSIKNVGSGVALETLYKGSNTTNPNNLVQILNPNDSNLIYLDIKNEIHSIFTKEDCRNTVNVSLYYKNTLSIEFEQSIQVKLIASRDDMQLNIEISELSTQKSVIDI